MKEIKLASGADLKIHKTPFADSKALFQAVLKEVKNVPMGPKTEMTSALKDIICASLTSPEVEAYLWKCFERCTLNSVKIDANTFEPDERRPDFLLVCFEVVKENILPFTKGLSAQFPVLSVILGSSPA